MSVSGTLTCPRSGRLSSDVAVVPAVLIKVQVSDFPKLKHAMPNRLILLFLITTTTTYPYMTAMTTTTSSSTGTRGS